MTGLSILQIGSHSKIASGGAVQMMRLAVSMRDRGHRVSCVFQYRPSDPVPGRGTFERFAGDGLAIRSFPFKKWPRRWLSIWALRRFIREGRFDVVHCHKTLALRAAIRALAGDPRPALIANRANSQPLTREEARAYGDLRVDRIVAVADAVKRVLLHSAPLDPTSIVVVYGGVDEKRFHPGVDGSGVRRELCGGKTSTGPLIGMIANLQVVKGHGDFLRAASIVRSRLPDARFVLVGGGHSDRIIPIVRELDLEDAVVFTGFREDVAEILAALDVSVSSSTEEGLNGTLREALAMARQVVATNVGGNSELVRHGESGILVPPRDPAAAAAAILDLLDDPERGRRLGAAGREQVLRAFTDDVRVRRIEEIYGEAVEARRIRFT